MARANATRESVLHCRLDRRRNRELEELVVHGSNNIHIPLSGPLEGHNLLHNVLSAGRSSRTRLKLVTLSSKIDR